MGPTPVFAGQFLDGSYGALLSHRENATYAGIAVALSALAGLIIRFLGRGPWWPAAGSAALFVAIAVQIVHGFVRLIAIHIPLGVAIVAVGVVLARRSWQQRPGRAG